mgnify:CR=1 FL=1
MLKKKIDFRKVERKVIGGRVNRLRLEAMNIVHGIVSRTQRGKDVKLRGFKSYKADYAKYRAKHGRDKSVNLTYSGRMLGAINSKKIPLGLRFYFASKSETDKATWNQKTRRFFGIDKIQIKYLKKSLIKESLMLKELLIL